jgi:hypothetical protein
MQADDTVVAQASNDARTTRMPSMPDVNYELDGHDHADATLTTNGLV